MILKCAFLFTVICLVEPASYYGRNIPVEVRYHDTGSNLSEKSQLSPVELVENQLRLEQLKSDNLINENQLKNDKLSEIQHKLEEEKHKTDLLSAEKASLEDAKLHAAEETGHRIGALVDYEKTIEANKRHSEKINKLTLLNNNLHEQTQLSPEETKQALKYIPEVQENEVAKSNSTEKLTWLSQAQNYIEKGLEDLKLNFKPSDGGVVPKPEFWQKLDSEVRDYFKGEVNKLNLKQQTGGSQQNFFQNLANGFQSVTNNFIQGFQGNSNATGQEDDTSSQQAPWQGFVGYFQGGVQNLVSTVQNFGQQTSGNGNSTVLGDSGNNQSPPFFGGIISNVQQFFQGAQNAVAGGNGTQSDTPATGTNPQNGFFQGAINQFNQVVGNFIPTSTPSSAQGDEAASATQAGPIQQVFQQFGNIGTAFNQFIQGGGQNPQASGDDPSTSAPSQNFIQNIGQNIGNAFQNIQNQFRPPSIPTLSGNDSSNPISGITDQIQQVAGQAGISNPLENINPAPSSGSSSSKQPADESQSAESAQLNEIQKQSSDVLKEQSRSEPIQEKIEESIKEKAETKIKEILETNPLGEENVEKPVKKPENQPIKKIEESKTSIKRNINENENIVAPEEQPLPADNIEEIIDNAEEEDLEEKPVETKKVETMVATE